MKVYSLLVALLLALWVSSAQAQSGPDDQFVGIYSMIQQADSLADTGQPAQALAEYTAAQAELQKFARIYPTWNPNIITFRERYLAEKIASTTAMVPAPAATNTMTAMPATTPAVAGAADDQLNALRQEVQNLQNDNAALATKLKEALTAQPAGVDPQQLAAAQDKIQALMKENDLLQATLANQKATATAKPSKSAVRKQMEQLQDEVKSLQARVSVDEATPVPYTAEEVALFQTAAYVPTTTTVSAPLKVENQMPAGADDLAASAKTHLANHEIDQAATDYKKMLAMDPNNAYALASLAYVEVQMGQLAEADKHVQASYAKNRNDPFTLFVMGSLDFQQEKYDAALDTLSAAAALDPQNPTVQNLLGVCLGHKGLRQQAETALRKAVTLDPNYGPAHDNLALIYLSEQPPRAALARWHYIKALADGQPHKPDLEKMLADDGAAVGGQ